VALEQIGRRERRERLSQLAWFEQRPAGSSVNYRGFRDGLAAVEVNNKTGFIDKTGKMVIAASDDYGSEFHGGIAQVTTGLEAQTQKSYYIDKTGKVIREQNPRRSIVE
jgi:hypothetical protein